MKKKPDAASARASKEPSEPSSDASADSASTLVLVRPIAIFAVLTVIFGRAFGSSLRGVAVGLGKLGGRVEFFGYALTQCFLMLAMVVSLGLVLAMLRASTSSFVRYGTVMLGGLITLSTLSASATRLPASSLAVSGGLACAIALLAAWDSYRTPFARAASFVLGFVGLGGLARVAAVALLAQEKAPNGYRVFAQIASSVGFVFDALAMVIVVGFVASRSRKPSSPATIVALGAALVATRVALGGASEDASTISVLFGRAVRALVSRPEPFGAPTIVTFFTFAAPCLAVAVLFTPTLTPALSGAIALLLLAHGAPDVPLCALMIGIASVATILAARDHRGIWTQIKRTDDGDSETAQSSQSTG